MTRKDFLTLVGVGAGALIVSRCLQGCSGNGTNPSPPSNVNLALDLTSPAYISLKTNGNYVYTSNGIIVAKTLAGAYIAVSQYCTHQGVNVVYNSNQNNFVCNAHGSVFNSSGAVANGPANSALKQYTTTLSNNGNTLTITG